MSNPNATVELPCCRLPADPSTPNNDTGVPLQHQRSAPPTAAPSCRPTRSPRHNKLLCSVALLCRGPASPQFSITAGTLGLRSGTWGTRGHSETVRQRAAAAVRRLRQTQTDLPLPEPAFSTARADSIPSTTLPKTTFFLSSHLAEEENGTGDR